MAQINAHTLCELIVTTMRKSGKSKQRIPRDTGLLQDHSINIIYTFINLGIIGIGGEKGSLAHYAPYLEFSEYVGRSKKINKHKGFIERFLRSEYFLNAFKRKYPGVKVTYV